MSEIEDMGGYAGIADVGQGTRVAAHFDRQSAMLTSQVNGRFANLVRAGKVFFAANQAATALTVALATTYTGLVVWNPAASNVNLEILRVTWAHSAAPTTIATIGLLGTGAATTTDIATNGAPLTVYNAKLAAGGGVGRASAGCTLTATPVWLTHLLSGHANNALPTSSVHAMFDIDGMIVVPPGAFCGIGALTVATGLGSIFWTEVPV